MHKCNLETGSQFLVQGKMNRKLCSSSLDTAHKYSVHCDYYQYYFGEKRFSHSEKMRLLLTKMTLYIENGYQ